MLLPVRRPYDLQWAATTFRGNLAESANDRLSMGGPPKRPAHAVAYRMTSDLLTRRLSAPERSIARTVTTSRPWLRKRAAGTQLLEKVAHDCVRVTAKRRRAESARALLSRTITLTRPM